MKKDKLPDIYEDITIEEEHLMYDEVCQRIINNPRFYLDNLDNLWVFRTSFISYYYKKRKVYK